MVSANLTELKALCIALDKDGVMSFDAASLDKAIAADPQRPPRCSARMAATARP